MFLPAIPAGEARVKSGFGRSGRFAFWVRWVHGQTNNITQCRPVDNGSVLGVLIPDAKRPQETVVTQKIAATGEGGGAPHELLRVGTGWLFQEVLRYLPLSRSCLTLSWAAFTCTDWRLMRSRVD